MTVAGLIGGAGRVGRLGVMQAAWPLHESTLWYAFGGATLADGIVRGPTPSVTRNDVAWQTNEDGTVTQVAANVARPNHWLTGATKGGLLLEGTRTGSGLWSRDLTNAAWVKSASMAAAKDATGVDGVANSASTLTSSAATQTCLQTVTKSSASHAFGPYIKRKTGTGTVEVTVNGGTNWQDVTSSLSTTSWYRASEIRTVANPQFGFRLTTSGDEIEVDFAGMETGAFVSSPMLTEGSTFTRPDELIETTDVSWLTQGVGTIIFEVAHEANTTDTGFRRPFQLDDGTNNNRIAAFVRRSTSLLGGDVVNGGAGQFFSNNSFAYTGGRSVVAMAYATNDCQISLDGTTNNPDTSATIPTGLGSLKLGSSEGAGGDYLFGVLHGLANVPRRVTNLSAITARDGF